jgi:hypothetical protein
VALHFFLKIRRHYSKWITETAFGDSSTNPGDQSFFQTPLTQTSLSSSIANEFRNHMEMKILRQMEGRNRKYIQRILGNISGGWLGFQRLVEGVAKREDCMLLKDREGGFPKEVLSMENHKGSVCGGGSGNLRDDGS